MPHGPRAMVVVEFAFLQENEILENAAVDFYDLYFISSCDLLK